MTRRRGRRTGALVMIAAVVSLVLAPGGTARAADPAPQLSRVSSTNSAVTVAGKGPFSGLRVTVGQTTNLVNQAVSVTWSGGAPTVPDSARFGVNYLQVMQCWGDSPSGPDRDQCEYGARAAFDDRGGDYSATRQLNAGSIVDPLEDAAISGSSSTKFAPFRSVTGAQAKPGNTNEFFDSSTTNELPYARTGADGTGDILFETLTGREAPGLGCGAVSGGSAPRKCWLVVVPRGVSEVDGTVRTGSGAGAANVLTTSPLSLTNWRQRIAVPLSFAPISNQCPLGAQERRTVGAESMTEAITRWQPALCTGGRAVYGFSQVPTSVGLRQLSSTDPGLVFTTEPAPSGTSPAKIVYAPVSVSALGISVVMDRQSAPTSSSAQRRDDGKPVTDVNLTQRVVAKLLTQSYQTAVPGGQRYLLANPRDLTRDPDFLRDNPSFANLQYDRVPDIMVPLGSSAANQQLWAWVGSDAAARDFLAGYPDPWGMRINPFYQGLQANTDSFPRTDPYCQGFPAPVAGFVQQTPLCTLDAFPYTADLHEATRAASRGDRLARTTWNLAVKGSDIPPGYVKAPVQLPGRRALLALSDTATAARFGLPMARLRNASGVFVGATAPSLSAAVVAMTTDAASGVRTLSPTAKGAGIYPLTSITYAATVPSALTQPQARDLAGLLRYAAADGQRSGTEPGRLPFGYVPLTAPLRAQTVAAAALVTARVGGVPVVATPPVPNPTSTGAGTGQGSTGAGQPPAAPAQQVPPAGQVPPGQAPGAQLSPGQLSPGQLSPGQLSPGQAPAGQVPAGQAQPAIPALPSITIPPALVPPAVAPVPGVTALTPATGSTPTPVPTVQLVSAARPRTPALAVGPVRYVIAAALFLGALALILAPLLPWLARRSTRSTG